MLRHFEGRQRLAAEGVQLVRRDRAARLTHYHRRDDFLLPRVRHSDNIGLFDRGMGREELLHFEGRDIDPSRLHHVLEPAPEVQASLLVEEAKVPTEEVAVRVEGGCVLFGSLVIAWHQVAADRNLTDRTWRQRLVGLGVGDLNLHPRERVAHGVEPYLNRVVRIGYRTVAVALGQAVDIADLVCTEVHDHLHGLWGTNSRPGAERAQVDACPVRMLPERQRHVGSAIEDRTLLALDESESL